MMVWPLLLYLVAVYFTFNSIEEDAFIYFRLADNIANGHGYVFNIGGERIESGSGLIWQMMLALLASFPVDLMMATKYLGLVFGVLSLWMMVRLGQRYIEDKALAVFPAVCLAVSTPFYFWSHRGLETPQFVFVLLWLLDWLGDDNKKRWWYVPAFLVFCSRPEGFLMVGAIMPWLWLERNSIPWFWQGVSIFVGLCILLLLGRLFYFHDLVPHAFYHKIGGDYARSLKDLLSYSWWNGLALLLLLALPALLQKNAWQRAYLPLLLLFAITAVWGVIGADWKSFNRQLSSWLPFVFLLLFIFIDKNLFRFVKSGAWIKPALLTVLICYALWLACLSRYTTSRGTVLPNPIYGGVSHFLEGPAQYHKHLFTVIQNPDGYLIESEPILAGDHLGFNRNATVGRFIHDNYSQGITVVFDQMGQAPWYGGSDKIFIDNTGLTDKQIGYHTFHYKAQKSTVFALYEEVLVTLKSWFWPEKQHYYSKKALVERLFAEQPELVLLRERYVKRQPNTLIGRFYHDPRFDERYRRMYRINKRDIVFERRDLPVRDEVVVPPAALVEPL